MIFVTVGTHQQPFTRLLASLDQLDRAALVVQYGPAAPPAGVARAVPFLSFGEMTRYFDQAEAVVTHAGVGSILSALRAGHRPVVVPRLRRYGEHVDDHQVELVRALALEGRVVPVWDTAELAAAVAACGSRGPALETVERPIHVAVRQALLSTLPLR